MSEGKSMDPPSYASAQQPGPPMGPPGYYQQPPMVVPVQTTVFPAAVVVTNVTPMGADPSIIVCKSCQQNITTVVRHKATTKTHLFALLLCLIGCWPCVCIPYCTNSCRNADHYCPNCEAYLGSYLG